MPRNSAVATNVEPTPAAHECPRCGKAEVESAVFDFDAEVRHDGKLHAFRVPALRAWQCRACGERIFTNDVDRQVNEALRSHLGLLSPREIRAGIDRVGMSQKEVAECLNIAEATLSRWLNEVQIQSKSLDTLLRVFFAFPNVRESLCAGASGSHANLASTRE